ARMAADGHEVGLSTVYRALAALVEAGQVDVVRDDAGERLFRHRRHDRHEHYLVCRECGFALALDVDAVEAWAERIARESGFSDVRHTVEFAGVCVACDAVPSPRPPTDRSHP
ncbi:transcriptional repressor, partial [Kitasatospora sp. NPDC093558]|uniref:Fur family transcriptional regulator n=1 Tax=Kitasatospora sp. NPDC093558 TaxID=3155201 RepID=UPI00342B50F0